MSFNSLAATAAVEGKMSKGLKKVLKKVFVSEMQEQLAVADAKLGSAIKVQYNNFMTQRFKLPRALCLSTFLFCNVFCCFVPPPPFPSPSLQEKLNISCVHSLAITELFRGIRAQMCNLITGLCSYTYGTRNAHTHVLPCAGHG